jgi:hypothetical protein
MDCFWLGNFTVALEKNPEMQTLETQQQVLHAGWSHPSSEPFLAKWKTRSFAIWMEGTLTLSPPPKKKKGALLL